MRLLIITPEQNVFDGKVRVVTMPGVDGSFQFLAHHAPLVGLLTKGVVEYKTATATERVHITGGVVETAHNTTVLLADGLVDGADS